MATANEVEKGRYLAACLEGIMSGSAVINQVHANDVDVFVPYNKWVDHYLSTRFALSDWRPHWWEDFSPEEYHPNCRDPKYAQAETWGELRSLFRCNHNINLIIVNDYFWPAYMSAHRTLSLRPDEFTNKTERHNLFIRHKNVIHKMLGNEPRDLIEEDQWEST